MFAQEKKLQETVLKLNITFSCVPGKKGNALQFEFIICGLAILQFLKYSASDRNNISFATKELPSLLKLKIISFMLGY